MTSPQLPPLPQALPRTQAEWTQAVNVLQTWQTTLAPLLALLDALATSATAGSASALPATPAGYANITIRGTTYKVAVYNT